MLFGIKYYPNKRGMTIAADSMQRFHSAIIPMGKCDLYFTNVIEAYLTAKELSKKNNQLKYKVFVPNTASTDLIPKERIVHTKEEYFNICHEKTQKLLDELSEMISNEHSI